MMYYVEFLLLKICRNLTLVFFSLAVGAERLCGPRRIKLQGSPVLNMELLPG